MSALCGCCRQPHRQFRATPVTADKEDYYQQLGIARSAGSSEVKKAYYKLAKKFHPDTNQGDPTAAKKFAEVTEAYEVLTDADKRSAYDAYGHAGVNQQAGGGGGAGGFQGFEGFQGFQGGGFQFQGGFQGGAMSAEDLFRAFEEAVGGGGRRQRGPARGRNVQVAMELTLEEAVRGTTRMVKWRSPKSGDREVEVRFAHHGR